MNQKELERLEKDSIYTMRVNSDLKDRVTQSNFHDLIRFTKKQSRNKKLIILLLEE